MTHNRDMAHVAMCLNRQVIDDVVRGCRNVVEYRRPPDRWNHVLADYLRTLRLFTEAQELARSLGMDGHPLLEPIAPLPIWRDDYRWGDVLARVNPTTAKAPKPVTRPSKSIRPVSEAIHAAV